MTENKEYEWKLIDKVKELDERVLALEGKTTKRVRD